MATLRQIEANRRNSQKSTGPRTAEGKAVSRFNALKSGIDAESAVIPGEDPATFQSLSDEYYARYQPATPEERDLLDTVISAVWQLRRLRRIETAIWTTEMQQIWLTSGRNHTADEAYHARSTTFDRLQKRLTAAERSFRQSLRDLQRLQAERQAAESSEHPEVDLQPVESKPDTTKLASFRQITQESPSPRPPDLRSPAPDDV